MTIQLDDRVALITGATAGIGAATAREFSRLGAKVIINGRRVETLKALEQEIDDEMGVETAVCVPGDCADEDVIQRMLQAGPDHFGRRVDLVVVNAGRGLAGSVASSDLQEWDEVIRTNLLAAARLMREAASDMTANGGPQDWTSTPRDIMVIGSTVGKHISPFSSMYGSTKAAVGSLAEALRRELAPEGIRVSLIAPGIVRSEFQAVAGYTDDLTATFDEKFGPLLEPEDIARTLAFMASQPAHVCVGDIVLRATRQDYP